MRLPRHLLIGLVVSIAVAALLAITWWKSNTQPRNESLAAKLPAEAVLAYAEFPEGDRSALDALALLAPTLDVPTVSPTTSAIAAVRVPDGTIGWMSSSRDADGHVHVSGSQPSLESLLQNVRTPLSELRTFRELRFGTGAWTYVSYPDLPAEGSMLGSLFTLDAPIAYQSDHDTVALHTSGIPGLTLDMWSGAPLAPLRSPTHTLSLPSWRSMMSLSTSLSEAARMIIESETRTFVDTYARNASIRYDLSHLLDGPSLLQTASNDAVETFSLDGRGSSAENVDNILRRLHADFATLHGGSLVQTITAERQSLTTLMPSPGVQTVESTDGTWTVLRTETSNGSLISAHNGRRFVLTNDPDALTLTANATDSSRFESSSIAWTDDVSATVRSLWPSFHPTADRLHVRLLVGPGHVEWVFAPVRRP